VKKKSVGSLGTGSIMGLTTDGEKGQKNASIAVTSTERLYPDQKGGV